MPTLSERVKRSWNAFMGRDQPQSFKYEYGSSHRPDRTRLRTNNARTIVSSIYTRIALDVSSIDIRHVRLDENNKFLEVIDGPLNDLFSIEANIDQTGRELVYDAIMSMFDEGAVALVPTDTSADPNQTDSYKIYKARTGKIKEWYPSSVKLEVYNELTGKKQDVTMLKKCIPIIENPFYPIMNEPNSTLQRLVRVLNQIDRTNEQNSAGKLDLIIQLPWTVNSEAKKQRAEDRRKSIEAQLTGSQYGIAYADATERITQLNRPVENNLWTQAKDLTTQLFNELGLTQSVFDGTADEKTMLNYYNRSVEPVLSVFVLNVERKWITKTARSQKQGLRFFRDPFKLVPVDQIAEIGDKFTRNEILTKNEVRSIIGFKPSDDPKANQLINSNINHPNEDNAPDPIDESDDPNQDVEW